MKEVFTTLNHESVGSVIIVHNHVLCHVLKNFFKKNQTKLN
jgi:hypothetical protein